jgi:hypothetical protein
LETVFSEAYGAKCGDAAYDSRADVNLDGYINFNDTLIVSVNYGDESWCEQQLQSTTNPCETMLGSNCTQFFNFTFVPSYGSECGDAAYDSRADVNLDGYINFNDTLIVSVNYGDESWCEQQLQSTTNPCEITLAQNCAELDTTFREAYGSECGDESYHHIADFCGYLGDPVKDGKVDFEDLMVYSINYGDEQWCLEKLKSISNPCGDSPICSNFLETVFSEAYGAKCGDAAYDSRADVNLDGKIDFEDLLIVSVNYGDESWCQERLEDSSNPCS